MKGSNPKALDMLSDQESIVSFGPCEVRNYDHVELEDCWSNDPATPESTTKLSRPTTKTKAVNESVFETVDAPDLYLRGIHGIAKALTNARLLAESVNGAWGMS